MRLLLDTHAFLWWVGDSPRLSRRAKNSIANARNQCLVSVASGWEIAIKVSLGKLRIDAALERFLPEQLAANGFEPLAIDLKHTARVAPTRRFTTTTRSTGCWWRRQSRKSWPSSLRTPSSRGTA